MADDDTPKGEVTPAIDQKPAPEPPKVPDPPAKAEDPSKDQEEWLKKWLPERLTQAGRAKERELFEQFKVKDAEELEAKLKELDELKTAQLTEAERQEKKIEELQKAADTGKTYQERFDKVVESQLGKLPEEQRNKILERAGNDTAKQFEIMELLSEFGGTAPKEGEKKPANTPKGNPAPTPGGSPKSALEVFEQKQAEEPGGVLASLFFRKNQFAIQKAREAAKANS